jgi:hypothetical protein
MSKTINYIAVGFFLAFALLILITRSNMEDCVMLNENETYKDKDDSKDKNFLNLNVYQNLPPDNYNYLVNYPNGPWSWGEWSWGSNGKSSNGTHYSTLEKQDKQNKNQRGLNYQF